MSIPKEFLIERQGRQMVLYAGLLELAHRKGLKAIRTRLVQPPLEVNGWTSIAHAEVELEDGRVFHGIGDANAQNVGRTIAPHAIRMSETRAKARALRDALSIGAVSLEELADEDEAPSPRSTLPASMDRTRTTGQDAATVREIASEIMLGIHKIKPDTKVELPPDDAPDAAWSHWVDKWGPALEEYRKRRTAAASKQPVGAR